MSSDRRFERAIPRQWRTDRKCALERSRETIRINRYPGGYAMVKKVQISPAEDSGEHVRIK